MLAGVVRTLICGDAERGGYAKVADSRAIGERQPNRGVALQQHVVADEAALSLWYRAGLAAGAVFFVYQQWLIRDREPDACFRAFNNNHYFGLVVFVGLALDYLYRG